MAPKKILWFIVIISLLSILIDLPKLPTFKVVNKAINFEFPLKLGLDLQGGTQLILQAQMDKIDQIDQDSALESAKNIIERRVNLYGLSEALVQSSKIGQERRILVELPGLQNASSAATLVGQTALLDFREVNKDASASSLLTLENTTDTGLTGKDLKKAQVTFGTSGRKSGPQVALEFTTDGAKKFADITKRNVGRPLAIFLDSISIYPYVGTAPIVQQEILGGNAVITGIFTTAQAKNLAIQLNAGALPVPIKILEQRSIGPTLGQESVKKSLIAGSIGLLIVMLYMISFYGFLGLIADLALIIYALIVLAIFKTGLFILPPVTLTLSGIAGFILSIGMAVDANILIFERMKEEIRWGKSKPLALELGFKRAWSSIWASNVSSLMTAAILYGMGATLIKGFAITLAIGVLVSMFTSYVVTRKFLRLLVK